VQRFGDLGRDLLEMVLADEDSGNRYVTAQWQSIRRWLDVHPGDEPAPAFRAGLDTAPAGYVRHQWRYLSWGVFPLRRR